MSQKLQFDTAAAPARKPSVDQWKNAVGMTTGIACTLDRDDASRRAAPEAVKAFSGAATALLLPYLDMHESVAGTLLESGQSSGQRAERIARATTTGVSKMCAAALTVADVARILAATEGVKQRPGLQMLASMLDGMVRDEISGATRDPQDREFMQRVRSQSGLRAAAPKNG